MGVATGRSGGRRWGTLALFTILSTLPDLDVLLVAFGASETGPFGHRGALHSLTMALAAGVFCALAARWWRWPVLRTALAGAAAVASHTLLDLLGAGGKSLALFWPLSSARFHSPWRLLPDAPRGLKLLSGSGLLEFVTEFALFLPITIYALWPQIQARSPACACRSCRSSTARARRRARRTSLRIPHGGIRPCARAGDRRTVKSVGRIG